MLLCVMYGSGGASVRGWEIHQLVDLLGKSSMLNHDKVFHIKHLFAMLNLRVN
jgi:hypothetical protein